MPCSGICAAGGVAGDLPDGYADEHRHRLLPRERAAALGLLPGAAFWLNGILFVASMVFFCVLFYLYSGHLRGMALPSAVLVAMSVTCSSRARSTSDGIREVALYAAGGLGRSRAR